jgi:RNA polymerase sigma-B factor
LPPIASEPTRPGERARGDRALFARRAAGDPAARDELVERFLPLARSIARRYDHSGEPLEDVMQVASLGLVKAVDGYDPARGCAFSSYAVPTIAGEIKRYFRDRTWAVRPPRDLQELTIRVDRAATELQQSLDRAPTTREIADASGCDEEAVLETMVARRGRNTLSFDAPVGHDDERTLQATLAVADDGYERSEALADLDRLLRHLPPRDRLVVRLRFEQDLTQAEIGACIGVSQMQVSRILRRTIAELRFAASGPPASPLTIGGGDSVDDPYPGARADGG